MKKNSLLSAAVTAAFALTLILPSGMALAGNKDDIQPKGVLLASGEVYDVYDGKYIDANKFPSNSSANKGLMKVSANKSRNYIVYNGKEVGYFDFNKNEATIDIHITDNVVVDVEWHCSKYYATAKLDGIGTYSLPQLLQDNGKPQSFDQIWIVAIDRTPVVKAYGRYLAYVELWNDLYLGNKCNGPADGICGALFDQGIEHYWALLYAFGEESLPSYWHFCTDDQKLYEEWANKLEDGLLYVFENDNDELVSIVDDFWVRYDNKDIDTIAYTKMCNNH